MSGIHSPSSAETNQQPEMRLATSDGRVFHLDGSRDWFYIFEGIEEQLRHNWNKIMTEERSEHP